MDPSAGRQKGDSPTIATGVRPILGAGARHYAPSVAIRLVMAEDNVLVREGARTLIALEDDLDLVGVSEDLDGLLELVEREQPDVVLTDIRMPPTGSDEGVRAAKQLRHTHPHVGVVVLSHYLEPAYALAVFAEGASGRGYLLKERVSHMGQLASAIREVARGGSVIDPKVVDALMAARLAGRSPLASLTPRERETLAEMAQGKTNAAIGEALVLSDRAVEKHINAVFTKLGLGPEADGHRRVKAVLLYLADSGRFGEPAP
jgi:DNA-binding NarL/FixJ family response regulator